MSSSTSPAATRCAIAMCAPACDLFDEPRADPAELHDAELAERRGEGRRRRRAPAPARSARRNASSAPSRSTSRSAGVNASPAVARSRSCPSSMHAASSASRSPPLGGELADLAGELGGAVVLLGGPERGGAAQPHVELEARVAERLGQRGELGEPLQPVARATQHVERPVARLQQLHALLRGRGRGRARARRRAGPPRARSRRARSGSPRSRTARTRRASPAAFA